MYFIKDELYLKNLTIISKEIPPKEYEYEYEIITARAFMNYNDFKNYLLTQKIKYHKLWLFLKDNRQNEEKDLEIITENYFYKKKYYQQKVIKCLIKKIKFKENM